MGYQMFRSGHNFRHLFLVTGKQAPPSVPAKKILIFRNGRWLLRHVQAVPFTVKLDGAALLFA
jgi:hypothetical protein